MLVVNRSEIRDEKMILGFEKPTKFGLQHLINVDFDETLIKGRSEDSSLYEIKYRKLRENEDYLNGLYN